MSQLVQHSDPRAQPIITGRGLVAAGNPLFRPRGLTDWLIWQTISGACRIETERGWEISRAGELILIAPHIRQHYGAADNQSWECVWAVFAPRAHWFEWLRWPTLGRGIMRLQPAPPAKCLQFQRSLQRTHDQAIAGSTDALDWAMNTLERLLLRCRQLARSTTQSGLDPRVERAVAWLHAQARRPITAEACARASGCSAVHLRRLFRAQIGASPLVYHERCRLERAANLLRLTGMSIKEIAGELGFADPLYFSTRFRRHYGIPPRAYRPATLEKTKPVSREARETG